MNKMYKATVLILICLFSLHANSATKSPWYGVLTVDTFPLTNCKVYDFKPVETWFSYMNSTTNDLSGSYEKFKGQLGDFARNGGWNAILGFQVNHIGGAGGLKYNKNYVEYSDVLATGLVTVGGVAVKVKCK